MGTDAGEKKERSTISKILETGSLVATWISLSLCLEIFGPTLIDLKYKLNTNTEKIAFAISGRSYGFFPGSLIGGFLADRFPRFCHVMVAVALDLMAGACVAIPWSPNVTTMWGICFFIGTLESIANIAGTRIVFRIWKDRAVTPLLLIHLGYGVGSFITPLYANPFLVDAPEDDEDATNVTSLTNYTYNVSTSAFTAQTTPILDLGHESKAEYAFVISACVEVLASLILYFYQFRTCLVSTKQAEETIKEKSMDEKPEEEKKSIKQMLNPASCAGGRFWYGVQLLAFLFVYFGNIAGGDRMMGAFIRTFSIDHLSLSKTSASNLNSAFWIGFSSGRLTFSIIGFFVRVRILVLLETAGLATTATILAILANNVTALWVLIVCLGFFAAPIWPTGIAWTDYHMELTGFGLTWQILGACIGGIIHVTLMGYLYENIGPQTFLYQTMGLAILQLATTIVLTLIGAQYGNRFEWDEPKAHEIKVEEAKKAELQYESSKL